MLSAHLLKSLGQLSPHDVTTDMAFTYIGFGPTAAQFLQPSHFSFYHYNISESDQPSLSSFNNQHPCHFRLFKKIGFHFHLLFTTLQIRVTPALLLFSSHSRLKIQTNIFQPYISPTLKMWKSLYKTWFFGISDDNIEKKKKPFFLLNFVFCFFKVVYFNIIMQNK